MPDLRPLEEVATDVPKPLYTFLPALLDNWSLLQPLNVPLIGRQMASENDRVQNIANA
jgi:hypothetical protein